MVPCPELAGSSPRSRGSQGCRRSDRGGKRVVATPWRVLRWRPISCRSAWPMRGWRDSIRSRVCGPALPALVLYALLGTSRVLSVGPESASALLVGSAIATLTRSADVDPATAAAALAVAVGVLAFVAWLARLGFLADFLSRPVLVGYLAGVAVIMVVSQLPNFTGIASERRDTIDRAVDVAAGSTALTSRRSWSAQQCSARCSCCSGSRVCPVRCSLSSSRRPSRCSIRPGEPRRGHGRDVPSGCRRSRFRTSRRTCGPACSRPQPE